MHSGAALLSVFLAGPALAVPPAVRPAEATSPAEILARINAGDPALTSSPGPVEALVEVAELAERRLAAATDPDEVAELLTHVGTAREIAHDRTGAAEHLCKLLTAARSVLARDGLPADPRAEAADFMDRTRATLIARHSGHVCVDVPRPEPLARALPLAPRPGLPLAGRAGLPRADRTDRADRAMVTPMTVAGGVSLGAATVLVLGLVGVRVHRGRAVDELADLRADIAAAGGKTVEQDRRITELEAINTRTRGATVGLAVSAAVLGTLGVGLLAAGVQRQRAQRAHLAPYGGPAGAGIVLTGRF